ncbi:hypothetical protein CJ030_MR7G009289 [Morella rubra]|uniref:Uncharacterized protein n=1 Tax=Morella rubra TaxID=262757 RepID=A0A6A1V481_9ROSI|nr:hypothetical protein CJ030_MR7G009289 [Morella rubra]
MRMVGQIPLDIPEGQRGTICDNFNVFYERVSYILRNFGKVHYKNWRAVPEVDKTELLNWVMMDKDKSLIDFYKHTCNHVDGSWVRPIVEQNYARMRELQFERDPTLEDEDVANELFHEVLGKTLGYVRGLGKSTVAPKVHNEDKD